MNKILLILCLVFPVSGFPKEVTADQLVERQGVTYEVNSTTPFTGSFVDYYDNGQLQFRGNLKDGIPDGPVEAYSANGLLMFEANFKDGELDGLQEVYSSGGQLQSTSCYDNGEEVDMSYCEK